jgi:hypothetical protein
MLATKSVDPSVTIFLFLTDSIDHRFEQKNYFFNRVKPSAQDFFHLKTIDLIDVFLQLIDYRYRSNRCFFRHRCPTMATMPLQHYWYQAHGWATISSDASTGYHNSLALLARATQLGYHTFSALLAWATQMGYNLSSALLESLFSNASIGYTDRLPSLSSTAIMGYTLGYITLQQCLGCTGGLNVSPAALA